MRRLVVPVLALTLASWLAFPLPLLAQGADLVGFAQAYIGARNAHDLDAVLECFAPDAVVRRRGTSVPGEVWDARDELVVREFLAEEGWRVPFSWTRGAGEIRALMAEDFRWRPRLEAFNFRVSGPTVTWDYREYRAELQGLPGIGPIEGVAAAEVQAGRIVRLTQIDDPTSIVRQRAAVDSFVRQRAGRAAPTGRFPAGGQFGAPEGVPENTAAAVRLGPDDPVVPRALAGAGAAAFALALLMRWRRSGATRSWPATAIASRGAPWTRGRAPAPRHQRAGASKPGHRPRKPVARPAIDVGVTANARPPASPCE